MQNTFKSTRGDGYRAVKWARIPWLPLPRERKKRLRVAHSTINTADRTIRWILEATRVGLASPGDPRLFKAAEACQIEQHEARV